MNAIPTIARKDLLQLLRDRGTLFWMFGMPLLFGAFFGTMFGGSGPGESNPLRVAAVAEGLDEAGRHLLERIDDSDAIEVQVLPRAEAENAVRRGNKLAWIEVVHAPAEELGMFAGDAPAVRIGIDPSRQAEKGLLQGLITEAMFKGFQDLMSNPKKTQGQLHRMREQLDQNEDMSMLQKVALRAFFSAFDRFLETPGLAGGGGRSFEPELEVVDVSRKRAGPPNAYSVSFPQSILWGIMGCAAGFAISLVRERRSGTMVRLQTAPIPRWNLLAGKALACIVSCLLVVAAMSGVGALVFGVTVGNVPALVVAAASAAACFAGIAMLLGSLAQTEQAVSGLAWGILLIFAMLGGGMVPQIAMPGWMLDAGVASPAYWTIRAMEGAIWRGFSPAEMAAPCAVLTGVGILTTALGAARLRRAG